MESSYIWIQYSHVLLWSFRIYLKSCMVLVPNLYSKVVDTIWYTHVVTLDTYKVFCYVINDRILRVWRKFKIHTYFKVLCAMKHPCGLYNTFERLNTQVIDKGYFLVLTKFLLDHNVSVMFIGFFKTTFSRILFIVWSAGTIWIGGYWVLWKFHFFILLFLPNTFVLWCFFFVPFVMVLWARFSLVKVFLKDLRRGNVMCGLLYGT